MDPLAPNQRTRAILGQQDERDALADPDAQPITSGVDTISGHHDGGDWFPGDPATGVSAAALSAESDGDPLVKLAASDFAQVADGLEDSDDIHMAEPVSHDAAAAWDAMHHPIDHSMPLDRVDWHWNGALG